MPDSGMESRIDAVMGRMRKLFVLFSSQREASWLHSELTMAQVKAFFVIAKDGDPSVGVVAKELQIGLSSASQVVDRLVKAGLVERRPHQTDRRIIECVLSEKGEALRRQSQSAPQLIREWLSRLHSDELAALETGLQALARVSLEISRKEV